MANKILEQLVDANTEAWADTQINGGCYTYSIASEGTIVKKAGGRSAKIEVRGEVDNTGGTCTGTAAESTKHRSQIRWINTAVTTAINSFGSGTGHWMGFSVYIPSDYPITQGTTYDQDVILFQFNAGPGGPEFHCTLNSDGRTIDISCLPSDVNNTSVPSENTKITNNWPIVRGGWNDFIVFRVRQYVGQSTPGRDVIWHNGTICGDHTGPNARNYAADGATNNFTTGIYWSENNSPPSSTFGAYIVYVDEMRIATAQENEILSDGRGTQAGYALVDPNQGTTNNPPPALPARYTIVDNDLNPSSYSESASWKPASNNLALYPSPGGTERYTEGETQGGGFSVITASFACGTWSAGNVSIALYARKKTDRSSGVKYTITVGGSTVYTGTDWNQKGSVNDWFFVTPFYQGGGTAVITISNAGSSEYVAADAVAYYVETGVSATGKICSLKNYVSFTNGTTAFTDFDTLTGGVSGASAEIRRVVVESGAFATNDAAGKIYIGDVTSGPFQAETGTDGGGGSATLSGAETQNWKIAVGTTSAADQEKTLSWPLGGQSATDRYYVWASSRKDNFNNGNIDATNDAVGNEICEEISTGISDDQDHVGYLIPFGDITDPVSGTFSAQFTENGSAYGFGCCLLINVDPTVPYDVRDSGHNTYSGTYHDIDEDTGETVAVNALTTTNDNVALISTSVCLSTGSDTCSGIATNDGSIDEVLFYDYSQADGPWFYADIRTVASASTAVGAAIHTYTGADATADGGSIRFSLNRAISSGSDLSAASYTATTRAKNSAAYEYDPIGDGYVTDGTSPYILEAVAVTNGTAFVTTNNTFVAQPDAGYDGNNFKVTYTVSDAALPAGQSSGVVTIPITNSPPTGQNETVTILAAAGNTDFPISTLTNSDSDGDSYIIVIDTATSGAHLTASAQDSGATLRVTNDGSASTGNNTGITFYYDDQSNTTPTSSIYTLTVNVVSTAGTPTGSTPVALSCYRNEEDVKVDVITLGTVTDPNSQPLSITAVNSTACTDGGSVVTTTYGEVYNSGEILYYSPLNTLDPFGATVVDSLTITISNGTNTVNITLNVSVLASSISSLLELTGDLSLI